MVVSRRFLQICVLLGGASGFSSLAAAQTGGPGVPFLSHEAVYDLSLQKARGNAAVNSATGRIVYKFGGSACEGYSTEFRQVSKLDSGEDKTTVSDLRSTSWEDGNAKSYRFKVDSRTNDGEPTYVDGIAERGDDGAITVKLKQPVVKTFTLDKSVAFPTEQIRRIIEAAKEGKSIFELTIYDGSDNGQKLYRTLTVIGRPIPGGRPSATPDVSTASDKLKSLMRWPVTVSYFDSAAKPDAGEQLPAYSMSFELYEDGVSRALVLDYNDFVIAGTMGRFEVNDSKPCK
ncbi:MAG: cell envelope integrity EipB family protein [Xanthobacteraceae bacterium]|nr:cell envelope integrity EipB family protein [Xanthobacteraceae bacterium]